MESRAIFTEIADVQDRGSLCAQARQGQIQPKVEEVATCKESTKDTEGEVSALQVQVQNS